MIKLVQKRRCLASLVHVKGTLVQDVIANFLGKGMGIFLSFLFIPFAVRTLGIEAYGLIGFYMTLQAVLLLLDFGFSVTLNRQLSSSGSSSVPVQLLTLSRHLERLFVVMAVALFGSVLILAPWFSNEWFSFNHLSKEAVRLSVGLMGPVIAFQLLYLLYAGGLSGLGLQVKSNFVLGVSSVFRYGGALGVLVVVPRVEAFFAWLILAGAMQVFWARIEFVRELRSRSIATSENTTASTSQHIGYAAGVGATAVLGVVLTQLDKVLLSKLLPLEAYGHYTLAWTLSAMLFVMAMPITTALFPRLAAYAARSSDNLSSIYHDGSQMLSVAVIPVAALLILFPQQLLSLWLGNEATAEKIDGLLVLLTIGTMLNTMAYVPHVLQLACGISKFGLYANGAMVTLAFPALILGVNYLGELGAAWVWVAINFLYVSIGIPLMHHWLLRGEFFSWLLRDVLAPFVAAFTVGWVCSQAFDFPIGGFWTSLFLFAAVYFAVLAASLLAAPRAKNYLLVLRTG